jgi:hypothetical protein
MDDNALPVGLGLGQGLQVGEGNVTRVTNGEHVMRNAQQQPHVAVHQENQRL